MNVHIQTNDASRHILVTRTDVRVISARQPSTAFSLTNTLKASAIAEARQAARAAGLRLANVKRVAISF